MSKRRGRTPLSLVKDHDGETLSDTELGRALMSGAPWAYERIWDRFAVVVRKMAISTLRSDIEAEDTVQEVFFRLIRKGKTLRQPECLHSFVVSFAVRVLQWQLRRRRLNHWLSFHAPETLTDLVEVSLDVESRDLLRRFYALLSRLGVREQLAYSLRHIESMTVEKTAEAMGVSVSTVKRLQERATKDLREWIEQDRELLSLLTRKRARDGR